MKSIADLKRKMIKGVKVKTTYNQAFAGRDKNGVVVYKNEKMPEGVVKIVKPTQVGIERTKENGEKFISWFKFPKRKFLLFHPNNTVTILDYDWRKAQGVNQKEDLPLIPLITYSFE